MIVEGVITLIIVGAMFYVAPGTLGLIRTSVPVVYGSAGGGVPAGAAIDSALNASQSNIATSVAGGLNLGAIAPIMLGIGLMIGAFMLVRRPR